METFIRMKIETVDVDETAPSYSREKTSNVIVLDFSELNFQEVIHFTLGKESNKLITITHKEHE